MGPDEPPSQGDQDCLDQLFHGLGEFGPASGECDIIAKAVADHGQVGLRHQEPVGWMVGLSLAWLWGVEEGVAARLLFREAPWGDGEEAEGEEGSQRPHRLTPAPGGFELVRGPFGDETEIDVALGPGLAAGVGAKGDDALDGQRGIHRLEALPERLAARSEGCRKFVEQQSHGGRSYGAACLGARG